MNGRCAQVEAARELRRDRAHRQRVGLEARAARETGGQAVLPGERAVVGVGIARRTEDLDDAHARASSKPGDPARAAAPSPCASRASTFAGARGPDPLRARPSPGAARARAEAARGRRRARVPRRRARAPKRADPALALVVEHPDEHAARRSALPAERGSNRIRDPGRRRPRRDSRPASGRSSSSSTSICPLAVGPRVTRSDARRRGPRADAECAGRARGRRPRPGVEPRFAAVRSRRPPPPDFS